MSGSDIDAPFKTCQSTSRELIHSQVQPILLLFCVLLFGLYLFLLLVRNGEYFFLKDPDVYWHVAVGQRIWQTGSLPYFDDLSHTFEGQPWIAKEWLSQLFLYGAYALAGWRGVVLLSACAAALTYALIFLILGRTMRLSVAIGVATVALVFSMGHLNARPLILADPLIVLWVAGLVHAVENRTSPSPLLLPLMTLWANVHGSFTFGLAIGAALAAEAFFESRPDQRLLTARRWALFLVAALAFACITPYGYRPIIMTFNVFVGNDAVRFVQEWQPVRFRAFGVNELIIFGLLFLALYHGVKLRFWRLILTLALIYLMFTHVRFAGLFAIVTPLLLAAPLAHQFRFLSLTGQLENEAHLFETLSRLSRRLVAPACVAVAGSAAAFAAYGPFMTPASDITPAGAVNYIYEHKLSGNVYNAPDFGGYLIYRRIKTFIDARNDQLFNNGFVTRLSDMVGQHYTMFPTYLEEYRISVALVKPDSVEAQELERAPGWVKVYSDDVSLLFEKERGDALHDVLPHF